MFHKFKITTCAFILCLFGLTLMTVSPVFAADSAAFVECQNMKWKKGKKAKKNCFRDLAQASQPSDGSRSPEVVACQDMKWKKGKKAKKNCFRDLARSLQAGGQAEADSVATEQTEAEKEIMSCGTKLNLIEQVREQYRADNGITQDWCGTTFHAPPHDIEVCAKGRTFFVKYHYDGRDDELVKKCTQDAHLWGLNTNGLNCGSAMERLGTMMKSIPRFQWSTAKAEGQYTIQAGYLTTTVAVNKLNTAWSDAREACDF
jgi:hypothetical protein